MEIFDLDLKDKEIKIFFHTMQKTLEKMGYAPDEIDIAIEQFQVYKMQEFIKESYHKFEQQKFKNIQHKMEMSWD